MDTYYTCERNVQMVLYLMKAHNIKKVIASPGTTNVTLVASMQQDPFFEVYSSVDERSAAYIACGLAVESGEPVALSCTGATASRNYLSGLTEAFYRNIPILAITSTQHAGRIGQLIPQVIDRTVAQNDIAKISIQVPTIHDAEDEWMCNVRINEALLELTHQGGGPVHINLETTYNAGFSVRDLPSTRIIRRFGYQSELPELIPGRVGVAVGAHKEWDEALTQMVDAFCDTYDAVVLGDHTSNYKGRHRVLSSVLSSQERYDSPCLNMSVLVHIGDVSGTTLREHSKQVWRVSPDGKIRDTFKKLSYVFEMDELAFFEAYVKKGESNPSKTSFYESWKDEAARIIAKAPELPFSNAWVAQHTASRLPDGCILHLGILNTLRSWNYFEIPESVRAYANTGGFGIDGGVSSLLGSSLSDPSRIHIGVFGDLAFFYDMNSIGNRHVGSNLRLMIVNNGRGTEFRNYNHFAARFGEDADQFMAAAGHYGRKSPFLIKHYAEDLGFEYLTASSKNEYLETFDRFIAQSESDKPILFEIFTDSQAESDAIQILQNLEISAKGSIKQAAREALGEKGVSVIKKMIGR